MFVYLLSNDRELMGKHRNRWLANSLTLTTIAILGVLTLVLVVSLVSGHA